MISDEELLAVYRKTVDAAIASKIETVDGAVVTGLRAVAALGAQRQRDMEPTEEMISAGYDAGCSKERIFRAMQRAAPLVTDREDGNG